MTAIAEKPQRIDLQVNEPYSKTRLVLGLLGRTWLWFLAASVVISLIPSLFGWNSYLIATGSMEPGISAGDIVVSSPGIQGHDLTGLVITFEDPSIEDHILTHRVVTVEGDGSLITKGDANPTPDTTPVRPEAVTGIGRLLVHYVGLPVIWARTGDWLKLFVFIALLVGSLGAVVRDYEPVERKTPSRRIPSLSGLMALITIAGLALPAMKPTVAEAAFNASTASQGNVWRLANLTYTEAIIQHSPYLYWKLDETGSGATAADSSGNGRTGSYTPGGGSTNFTKNRPGALVNNTPNRAVRLNSANACINTTSNTAISAPQVFTVIAWFKAPSTYTSGGKLIGFERPRTGVLAPSGGAYDRHIYMDGQGRIWFGVYNNAHVALSSSTGLNNNGWHMAVGTQSSAGMRLYIDGVLVDSNSNTVAETQDGWWRAGCGNLAGWGDQWNGNNDPGTDSGTPQNRPFQAELDEITVFNTALTDTQVANLYAAR